MLPTTAATSLHFPGHHILAFNFSTENFVDIETVKVPGALVGLVALALVGVVVQLLPHLHHWLLF